MLETKELEKIELESNVSAVKEQIEHLHYLLVTSSNKIVNAKVLDIEEAKKFTDAKNLEQKVYLLEAKIKALAENKVQISDEFKHMKALDDFRHEIYKSTAENFDRVHSKIDFVFHDLRTKINSHQ